MWHVDNCATQEKVTAKQATEPKQQQTESETTQDRLGSAVRGVPGSFQPKTWAKKLRKKMAGEGCQEGEGGEGGAAGGEVGQGSSPHQRGGNIFEYSLTIISTTTIENLSLSKSGKEKETKFCWRSSSTTFLCDVFWAESGDEEPGGELQPDSPAEAGDDGEEEGGGGEGKDKTWNHHFSFEGESKGEKREGGERERGEGEEEAAQQPSLGEH